MKCSMVLTSPSILAGRQMPTGAWGKLSGCFSAGMLRRELGESPVGEAEVGGAGC